MSVIIYIQSHVKLFYHYNDWYASITLGAQKNHLWTIPLEIRYYLLIPSYILFVYKLRKYSNIVLTCSILSILYIDYFNVKTSFIDLRRNSIFFKASLIALLYEKIEKQNLFIKIKNNYYFRSLMCALIVIISYAMAKKFARVFNKEMTWGKGTLSSEYYSLFLFIVVLIGAPNSISNFMENKLLTNLGKYSFGIYLWHPILIDVVKYQVKNYLQNKQSTFYLGTLSSTEKLVFLFIQTYLCGYLFFRYIENPSMKFGYKLCKRISSLSFFSK